MPVDAPSLRELQRAFAARVLGGAADAAPLGALAEWLVAAPGAALGERLAVHVDGYPARLVEALLEQFPAVAHLVGTGAFQALVGRYQRGVPPDATNLNFIGAALPAFLRNDPLAAQLPFLPDLAELEWRQVIAFHAADGAPFEAAALRGCDLEEIAAAPLSLRASVGVVGSRWPIHALWQARETPRAEIDLDLGVAEHVLVWRDGFAVRCAVVAADEAAALALLAGGGTLAAIAESLAASGADPARVGAWFAAWMQRGVLAAID